MALRSLSMQTSAGLLLHRRRERGLEVLLVHPGGPFWASRDAGAWSIPKGLVEEGEDPLAAARREFEEELGLPAPEGPVAELGEVVLRSRKRVVGFAVAGDIDTDAIVPGTFEMEWPPRSGRTASFPEVDRAAWSTPAEAAERLNPAQVAFVERLEAVLGT